MEAEEITLEAVHCVVDVLLGHTGVDHEVLRGRWGRWVIWEQFTQVWVLERVKRKVPPDAGRVRISPDGVFEPAGVDLVIVGGVTPTANAERRVVKERGVVYVFGVWVKDKRHQFNCDGARVMST